MTVPEADFVYVHPSDPRFNVWMVERSPGEFVAMTGHPIDGIPLTARNAAGFEVIATFTENQARVRIRNARSTVPYCCDRDCGEDAEYEIRAVRDGRDFAGPDPYSDTTHACTAHVGVLLGMQPDCPEPERVFWEVLPLTSVFVSC